MHYLLFYEKSPDYISRQAAFQAEHSHHVLAAIECGNVRLAGSLDDPDDGSALLLFQSDSPAAAETFAKMDPYVINGIVSRWHVRRWDIISAEAHSS